MRLKSLVVFAILGLSVASAKTFQITLDSMSKAGSAELKPGTYDVALDASKVRFVDPSTQKAIETTAKIVNVDKKFRYTAVETKQENGGTQIQEIDLGGTKTKIQFE